MIVLFFYFRTNFKYLVAHFEQKSELHNQEYVISLRFLLQNNISPKFIITGHFQLII